MNDLLEFIDVSTGRKKADLVFKDARIINVFSHEIIRGDLAVHRGYIVGVGDFEGVKEIDVEGAYLSPGLTDAHVHIESSMLSPENMAELIIPRGTTTLITDPHEIANVSGRAGIEYMLRATEDIPLNVFVNLPSCVPATSFESSGATLTAEDLEEFIGHKRVLGLAEFMNFPGITAKEDEVIKKLEMARKRGKVIDGHAPGMRGRDTLTYSGVGISTDHESETFEELLEKVRSGMYVHIREGSGAKNLEALAKTLPEHLTRWCCLCTDDSHPGTLLEEGHIDLLLKKLVKLGVDPITAIQMGTINPATCYKLGNIGALAPGYIADIVVFEDLRDFRVLKTYKSGVEIYDGKTRVKLKGRYTDKNLLASVDLQVEREDLKIRPEDEMVNIIEVVGESLLTIKRCSRVTLEDGEFHCRNNEGYLKLIVAERHHGTGNIGRGIIKNFGNFRGAVATTISHDSHNLIVVGDRDEDIYMAIEEIKKIGGGVCLVHRGRVEVSVPLEIGGIMTQTSGEVVAEKLKLFMEKAYSYGVDKRVDPLINLTFLALPVIPEIKLTDRGLFEFSTFKHIPLECGKD